MAKKCAMCKTLLTGVRRDKKTCSDGCRVNLSRLRRLIVAKEQGLSVTNPTRAEVDNYCTIHQVDKKQCQYMKDHMKGTV